MTNTFFPYSEDADNTRLDRLEAVYAAMTERARGFVSQEAVVEVLAAVDAVVSRAPLTPEQIRRLEWEAKPSFSAWANIDEDQIQALVRAVERKLGHFPVPYADSTPQLSVRDSAFTDWFFHHRSGRSGDVVLARDAYAAGMGDPLVMANPEMQVWRNTTVPMTREEPEAPAEVGPGDTVKWGSGPEDFEVVRRSNYERLWVLRRLGAEGGLFRARQDDLQMVRRAGEAQPASPDPRGPDHREGWGIASVKHHGHGVSVTVRRMDDGLLPDLQVDIEPQAPSEIVAKLAGQLDDALKDFHAAAQRSAMPAPELAGWQERQQTNTGWTAWYDVGRRNAVGRSGAALSEVIAGIEYQWRPVYALPDELIERLGKGASEPKGAPE